MMQRANIVLAYKKVVDLIRPATINKEDQFSL
jgi:hypothetical protein